MNEMKSLIDKQENEILKLKAMIQEKSEEQDELLQKILKSVENPCNDVSQLQCRRAKYRLQKSHSSNTDDGIFPFLPK